MDNITLLDVQNMVGERIKFHSENHDLTEHQKKIEFEKSMAIANLAKQYIKGADVALRANKLIYESKLESNSPVSLLIGGGSSAK